MRYVRMCHAYCFGWNPCWNKMGFQMALNKTFCTTTPKINKTMLSFCLPFIGFSIQSSQYQNWKDLLNKISDTIDNVASIKEIRIKNDTQEWFDNEVAEAIKTREKYFKKFKKSNLRSDYNFYIEAKYNTQKLIKQKKIEFF